MTRRLIVLTGAGISAPSGLATFRDDKDGFWKKYDSDEVCNAATRTTKAHYDFMNLYRKLVSEASPNRAHNWLAQLERKFGDKVKVYTTNIDDLHTMAGSQNVVYLHGCVNAVKCDKCNFKKKVGLGYKLVNNDENCWAGCSLHGRMRNDVVLFGEAFGKEYEDLHKELREAIDGSVFLVIGSSLSVYSWDTVRTRATKIFVNTDDKACEYFSPCFHHTIIGDMSDEKIIRDVYELIKGTLLRNFT